MSAPDTEPPSATPETRDEGGFLTRWSRRKRAAEAGRPLPEPTPSPPAQSAPPADLPDPATLSFDDDFTAYLGAQVPAALKRAAMAKLFADPSFNKMDGLDVYIEDYNLVPDLSAEERDLLAHAREVLNRAPTADDLALPSSEPAADAEPPAAVTGPEPPPGPGESIAGSPSSAKT